jgi:hypothetical protein
MERLFPSAKVQEVTSSRKHERERRGRGREIAILAIVVLVAAAATLICQPICETKRTEQILNDQYGESVAFVPTPDGSIPPERVEAFVRVREQVFEYCTEFRERVGEFIRLDSLKQDENVPKTVAAREGISGLKELFGLGPAFLRFMETRNHALLKEEMGLGEYFYIYVLAYIEQLGRTDDTRFAGVEQAYVGSRARRELIQILSNQSDLLMPGDARPADAILAAELRDQIARLSDGRQTLPWEDGLPPAITASFEPYAEPLAQLYCEGIAKIELMQKNKGFNVKN